MILTNHDSYCIQKQKVNNFLTITFKNKEIVMTKKGRPDTSRRQQRRLPPLPLVIALVPLKCSIEIYNFLMGCPLPKRKCLGALTLSIKKHTGLKRTSITFLNWKQIVHQLAFYRKRSLCSLALVFKLEQSNFLSEFQYF